MIMLIVFSLMYPICSTRAKRRVRLRRAWVMHKRAITARIVYALEKTIIRVEKDNIGLEKTPFTG